MSRIDLKGFGGRCLPNNFDDFNFDVLPEDDDFDGELPNENIDAINDETFGAGVEEDVSDDDLEQYSNQTAGLQLDDETSEWLNELTGSVSAPHPSELPAPPFGFSAFPTANLSSSNAKIFEDLKMQFGMADTLWENVNSTASSLYWDAPELSTLRHSSSYGSINERVPDRIGYPEVKDVISPEECFDKSDGICPPLALLKNTRAPGVDRSLASTASKSADSTMLPLPSVGAVTVTELERQLLMQSSGHVTASVSDVDRSTGVLVPNSRIPPIILPAPPPPPLQCLPFPMLPPFTMQIIRAYLFGQIPELPPGFPLITPQMRTAILSLGPPPVMRMPLHPMVKPFPLMQQPPHLMTSRPTLPVYLSCRSQPRMHSYFSQGSQHNVSCTRDRLSKLTGLVSNKTISDFALSPFAGFVSKKERSWLIKIQQLQCQGSGNPYEDDFYYTTWKQQKMTLEKHREGLKAEEKKCSYMWNTTNQHHFHYVPPTFVGSLGKPTLSTVNYPRQLIDLSNDLPDDDDKLPVKSSTSQKKLRALLLQLENAAFLILECNDRHRILCTSSLSDEVQEELRSGVESRMKTVIETLCFNERLQAVLLINKGRRIFARTLSLANEQQQFHLLHSFFAALSFAVKKISSNEMNESLLVPIFKSFSHLSKNTLISFVRNLKLDPANDITMNLFMTNLFISLLVCCSRQNCALDKYFCTVTLSSLIRPCSEDVKCSLEQYIVLTLADIKILDAWSASNIAGYHGSASEKLIQNLQIVCKPQGSSN